MLRIEELRLKWSKENANESILATDEDILLFQINNNVVLPDDVILYLRNINGIGDDCTDTLYEFYSLKRMKNIITEFEDWEGIPDYRLVFNKLDQSEKVYVFGNYNFSLFTYAIKLYPEHTASNEIFVISGGEYKKIADSFSDFIKLYLIDSIELELNL